ncbi:hypothetical protein ACUHGC_04140 [Testudinibacter sp. P27/CKL/0425]
MFVTHNVDEALKLGDRIAVMQGGVLQQVAEPEVILNRPANHYVRRFFRSAELTEV